MTELAEAPVAKATRNCADSPLDRRQAGRGNLGTGGSCLRPRPWGADGRGRPRVGRRGRRGGRERRRGVRVVARDVALETGGALLLDPRALPRATRGSREDPHRRAWEGALGRDGRGGPGARGDRVRLRDPDARQGGVLRAGLDGDRRLLDPPATRRRGRDHAVQLPGDGAHVDVGAGDRVWQLLHPQALREGPLGVALDR